MSQFTTETLPLPKDGVTRTCMAETACPTVMLGHDDQHAAELLTVHEFRAHGIALPKRVRRG